MRKTEKQNARTCVSSSSGSEEADRLASRLARRCLARETAVSNSPALCAVPPLDAGTTLSVLVSPGSLLIVSVTHRHVIPATGPRVLGEPQETTGQQRLRKSVDRHVFGLRCLGSESWGCQQIIAPVIRCWCMRMNPGEGCHVRDGGN